MCSVICLPVEASVRAVNHYFVILWNLVSKGLGLRFRKDVKADQVIQGLGIYSYIVYVFYN